MAFDQVGIQTENIWPSIKLSLFGTDYLSNAKHTKSNDEILLNEILRMKFESTVFSLRAQSAWRQADQCGTSSIENRKGLLMNTDLI